MALSRAAAAVLFLAGVVGAVNNNYYGKKIGKLTNYFHEITGDVYAVDAKTLHIRGFKYDGAGPDAYFWAGSTDKPGKEGFIVPDERGSKDVLQPYSRRHLTLTLPDGKTLKDIKWFSVWCRKFTVNFGDIMIPEDLEVPRPLNLGPIAGVEHQFSTGPIILVDAQTFMVPNMTLDGLAPDAHFWVGKGDKPTAEGILVPDENGSDKPLGLYDHKTVVISLPDELTVFDIDYFGVWCRLAAADFGHLILPVDLDVPPSPRMLGQSVKSKLNCEVLNADPLFEVRWAISGENAILQLVAQIHSGQYMSFGLSGDHQRSFMVGGDVTVAWVDPAGAGHAVDYFLDAKAQCSLGRGVCPDDKFIANSSHVTLLSGGILDGFQMVTYHRALNTGDHLDKPFVPNFLQSVIWALGPLNSHNEASYHTHRNAHSHFIAFGRTPSWNCPSTWDSASSPSRAAPSSSPSSPRTPLPVKMAAAPSSLPPPPPPPPSIPVATIPTTTTTPEPSTTQRAPAPIRQQQAASADEPWYIPPIECHEPADGVFYAQIGPTGGQRGYSAITGHVGWGIAWYINGLLIPEITVIRGRTYRFVVEGGNHPDAPARNHPFYITDDPEGGYAAKTPEERAKVRIFAGVTQGREGPYPTGLGYLCQWTPVSFRPADTFATFGEYQRHLELKCDEAPSGRPGMVTWTPNANTPDTVYYQCYTHRYLGWKIHVVDSCEQDLDYESSILDEVIELPSELQQPRYAPQRKAAGDRLGGFNALAGRQSALSSPNTKDLITLIPQPPFRKHYLRQTSGSGELSTSRGPAPQLQQQQQQDQHQPQQQRREDSANDRVGISTNHRFQPLPRETEVSVSTNIITEVPAQIVAEPFSGQSSIPFHGEFRPGMLHFGGFHRSSSIRSSGPVAVALPEPMVPIPSSISSKYPSPPSIGPFVRPSRQPMMDPIQASASEQSQSMVVYRAAGGSSNIPPLPAHLPLASSPSLRPPPPLKVKAATRPVSYDGSPVTNARFSASQPHGPSAPPPPPRHRSPALALQQTRQYGPFRGPRPPPVPEKVPPLLQFRPRLTSTTTSTTTSPGTTSASSDYAILSNVWNIISSQGRTTRHRRSSATTSNRRRAFYEPS